MCAALKLIKINPTLVSNAVIKDALTSKEMVIIFLRKTVIQVNPITTITLLLK